MIALSSRAFFRIPRASQFANSYVFLIRTEQLLGYRCYHGLSYISKERAPKGIYCSMDWNKKGKTVTPIWRPISTQSNSNEECSVEDVMSEPGDIASIEQGDPATTSASQNSFGVGDAEQLSVVSKEKHAVSIEVGASVMRFIRGKYGSTQKGIEDMGVKIIFPSSEKEDSIVIEGYSLDVITKASEKIQAIIDEAVKSPALNYSHFISLPLAIHPELVGKLTRFQSTILRDSNPEDADVTMDVGSSKDTPEDEDIFNQTQMSPTVSVKPETEDDTRCVKADITNMPLVSYAPKASKSSTLSDLGIDKSIFIKPKTFHLTVLMLKLWNKERVHAAMEVLQSVSSKVIEVLDNRPLFVRLKGLECMRGSRAKAEVLYAPVEEIGDEGRLSRACQVITDAYVKAGLVLEKDARHKLKLHATVMNTTNRKGGKRSSWRKKDTFDARGIFEQFGSELWGDYLIQEAHLSQRFLYDENGYYHCCASIPFPENSQVCKTSAAQADLAESA